MIYHDPKIAIFLSKKSRRTRAKIILCVSLICVLLAAFTIGFALGEAITAHAEMAETPEADTAVVQPMSDCYAEPAALGTYRITAYCGCEKCCGDWAKNRRGDVVYGAAGTELVAGISCASPLPLGTVVEIEGLGERIVQDKMASWVVSKRGEKIIDVYFDSHDEAQAFGVRYADVSLKWEE